MVVDFIYSKRVW